MKTSDIPPRHNKTIWYLSRVRNAESLFLVLQFIVKRYIKMLGISISRDDELLVFIERLRIYFVPLWAELDSYNGTFLKKIYEPFPEFALENCRVILDCGANIGIFTLKYALSGTNRIISIEPNPLAFNRLRKNIAANHITNVTALNMGLSSSGGTAKLHWGHSTLGGSINKQEDKSENIVDIELTTLDDIVEEYDITSVDLLKIDDEGSEHDALTAAEKTLSMTKRVILEYHSNDLKDQCKTLLVNSGFKTIHEIPEHRFYMRA
jgi:FkbM family methyltransferase